ARGGGGRRARPARGAGTAAACRADTASSPATCRRRATTAKAATTAHTGANRTAPRRRATAARRRRRARRASPAPTRPRPTCRDHWPRKKRSFFAKLLAAAVEDAVDERRRLVRAEALGDLDRLVDRHLRRHVAHIFQ